MDDDRARELLAEERRRIEQALATSTVVTTDDESTADDADNATDTYQNEFDEGRSDDLNDQLAAVERAEQRLADGRFGLSVESGDPIPDERLEAIPTAERTVAEEQRFDRGPSRLPARRSAAPGARRPSCARRRARRPCR